LHGKDDPRHKTGERDQRERFQADLKALIDDLTPVKRRFERFPKKRPTNLYALWTSMKY